MFNAKRFAGASAFFLTAFIFSAVFFSAAAAKEFTPEHVVLTWTGDPAATQTITWKTGAAEPVGEIQYAAADKENFPENAAKITAKSEIFSANSGEIIIHTATLTGLKPGLRYIYRLGNSREWSKIYSFAVAAPDISRFKFLVFGDSQSVRYDTWRDSVRQAYQNNPDAAFLTVVGDLVDVGEDYKEWEGWFNAAAGVIDAIAVMPLTGNHENYTPRRTLSMPEMFAAQFKLPANGPENFRGCAYSFDYGNTHFVILDSQESEESRFAPDMLAKQKAWLEEDLAAAKKPWKIVFFHKPPYHSYAGRGNESVREAFAPVFDKYRVNMVINGHDHVYARTYPLFDGKIAAPGYGTVYITAGRSGTKTAYQNARAHELHAFFHNPAAEPNYLTVEVEKNRLTIKAFKQSGVLLDCLIIEKQSLGAEAA